MDLPDFDDLPELEGLGLRHAWDVFGRDDVLGSINLVTPERVAAAAQLVQHRRDDLARPAPHRARPAPVRPPALPAPRDRPQPPRDGRLPRRLLPPGLDPVGFAQPCPLPGTGLLGRPHPGPDRRPDGFGHRPLGQPRRRRAGRAGRRGRLAPAAGPQLRPPRPPSGHRCGPQGRARTPGGDPRNRRHRLCCASAGSAPTGP